MLAHGTLLALVPASTSPVRVIDLQTGRTRWWLPPGIVAGRLLVHRDGRLLTWFDLASGARLRSGLLDGHGTFALVGASVDGGVALLARTERRTTTFAFVSATRSTALVLPGHTWTFVAMTRRVLYTRHHGELWRDEFAGGGNQPLAALAPELLRLTSSDHRYVFALTLSRAGNASVLMLDVARGATRTIALPGDGDATAASTYTLLADVDGRHLWALSPGEGRVVHIDLLAGRIDDTYRFAAGKWNVVQPVAAMAPDGETIALADGSHLWFVHLATRRVVRGRPQTAIAIGYSPDDKHLWGVGQRGRVTALRVR